MPNHPYIFGLSLISFSAMILEFASFMGPSYSMTNYFALFVLQVGIFLTFLWATVKGTVLLWVRIIRNSWHDNRISRCQYLPSVEKFVFSFGTPNHKFNKKNILWTLFSTICFLVGYCSMRYFGPIKKRKVLCCIININIKPCTFNTLTPLKQRQHAAFLSVKLKP